MPRRSRYRRRLRLIRQRCRPSDRGIAVLILCSWAAIILWFSYRAGTAVGSPWTTGVMTTMLLDDLIDDSMEQWDRDNRGDADE